MRTHLSLVRAIGFCLAYIALDFLSPIVSISLCCSLALCLACWQVASPQPFKPTRLQWLGFGVLSLVLFLEGYLPPLTERTGSKLSQSSWSSSSS